MLCDLEFICVNVISCQRELKKTTTFNSNPTKSMYYLNQRNKLFELTVPFWPLARPTVVSWLDSEQRARPLLLLLLLRPSHNHHHHRQQQRLRQWRALPSARPSCSRRLCSNRMSVREFASTASTSRRSSSCSSLSTPTVSSHSKAKVSVCLLIT